jgi:Ca2+-binding EF-hand superfamily protein
MYKKYNLPTAEPQMIDREFTDTELKAFRDAFRMFDLDGGGTFV